MQGSDRSLLVNGDEPNYDDSVKLIFQKLDQISRGIPNAEIKIIGDKYATLEKSQQELKNDIRHIKKILLDPEDGLIVKLNRALALTEKQESYKNDILTKSVQKISELESWKDMVSKVIWIIFTTMLGIILNMVLKK